MASNIILQVLSLGNVINEQYVTEAARHTYATVFTNKTIWTHTFWSATVTLTNLIASTGRIAF